MNDWKTIVNELDKAKTALENVLTVSDCNEYDINKQLGYTTSFDTMISQQIELLSEWRQIAVENEMEGIQK